MNILFLSNIVTPYQLELLKKLNEYSHINMYGYFLFAKEKNRDWNLDLPSYAMIADFNYEFTDYKKLYNFIKMHKIEKIIIGGYSLPTTLFTILICKLNRINLYFWLERPIKNQMGIKRILKNLYLKSVLSRAFKVFSIGKVAKSYYIKFNKNTVNLPYSMNLDRYYQIKRRYSEDEPIRYLFSGQFIDRKNIINTILAFKSIPNNTIRLNIIGGGELENKINEMIKDDVRIKNIGFIQPEELPNIYAKNDIFLMPSKHDGWALVINEAMAASMPIISTDKVGAVVEYIKHKENGYICDIEKNSIQKGIKFYLDNPHLIREHGSINKRIIQVSKADVKNASEYMASIFE